MYRLMWAVLIDAAMDSTSQEGYCCGAEMRCGKTRSSLCIVLAAYSHPYSAPIMRCISATMRSFSCGLLMATIKVIAANALLDTLAAPSV